MRGPPGEPEPRRRSDRRPRPSPPLPVAAPPGGPPASAAPAASTRPTTLADLIGSDDEGDDAVRVAQAPAGPPGTAPTVPSITNPAAATPAPLLTPGDLARSGTTGTNRAGRRVSNIGRLSSAPIMQGDQAPASMRALMPFAQGSPPPPPPPSPVLPPTPPTPNQPPNRRTVQVPWIRGFKIGYNQSPLPPDRVFVSFNYFNDLNGEVNRALGSGVSSMQLFRELFGAEKTLLDGDASLGFRLPLDTLVTKSAIQGLGGTTTAVGNMTFFGKYVLWRSEDTSDVISTGMAVTVPNGPKSFAGSPAAVGFHDAQIQPFVGYFFNWGDFFLQGFEAIDVPTGPGDVTEIYNDIGIGYYVYQDQAPGAFLRAVAPIFETHINVPVNHRGALRISDPAGTADVVDLTFGVNFFLRRVAALDRLRRAGDRPPPVQLRVDLGPQRLLRPHRRRRPRRREERGPAGPRPVTSDGLDRLALCPSRSD